MKHDHEGLQRKAIVADVLALQNTEVFVAGDLILDSYLGGQVERISPEAPVPVVHLNSSRNVLGGAANVAANIASIGAQVTLCGRIGSDSAGDSFIALCEEMKIDVSCVLRANHLPTTRKTRVFSGAQQLVRLDEEEKTLLSAEHVKQVILSFERFCSAPQARFANVLNGAADSVKGRVDRALVLSDYDKGVLTSELLTKLIEIAKRYQVPVITDPKKDDVSLYRGSTVIKPNKNEAAAILGRSLKDMLASSKSHSSPLSKKSEAMSMADQYVDVVQKIRDVSGAENVVLSLSAAGVVCGGKSTDGLVQHFPSTVLKIADVSGAGDTMVAVLSMGLAAGLTVARATQLGNIAAGLVCAKPGTATLSSSELIQGYHMADGEHLFEKIVGVRTVVELSARLKGDKQKTVFTNGCFDLLHPGHIQTLVSARSQGHFLIVGLNADVSVKKLKGDSRPIQDETSRAIVLAALSFVDFVVIFEEETPLELIRQIKPDVLVKGGDYQVSEIVGAAEVLSWGGSVITVPVVPKQSTTQMIERSKIR